MTMGYCHKCGKPLADRVGDTQIFQDKAQFVLKTVEQIADDLEYYRQTGRVRMELPRTHYATTVPALNGHIHDACPPIEYELRRP